MSLQSYTIDSVHDILRRYRITDLLRSHGIQYDEQRLENLFLNVALAGNA